MSSIHVTRWIENLKETNHELYWFDVLNRGKLNTMDSVIQFTAWEKRKVSNIKGEYFLSKKLPFLYEKIQPYLEITANEALESLINEIQPDLIHSFEMQGCSYPILKTMQKFPKLKWLYTCWGNDLFYYRNLKEHKNTIKNVLKRVDFLHTDCIRDFKLAIELGFQGEYLGVIPGGTGYKIKELEKHQFPLQERKNILVKGYEHQFGRGLNIVKALELLQKELANYQVIVFGAHSKVINYIKVNNLPFKFYSRHGLSHEALMQLMGKSLIYIGNSISDGIPNTLLEAIVMGAFPIQSDPGGATAEIITDGQNGFLIRNVENSMEIKKKIEDAITNISLLNTANNLNTILAHERLDYNENKKKVLALYEVIAQF